MMVSRVVPRKCGELPGARESLAHREILKVSKPQFYLSEIGKRLSRLAHNQEITGSTPVLAFVSGR